MYDKQQYRNWYEKTKEKRQVWNKAYYQKHKEHILEMHKTWAQKNVDQTGSIWKKYSRRKRIQDPNLDKERRLRKKARMMYKPLPESLTIKRSGIDGLGLFAKKSLEQGTNLGMSHVELGKLILRTPLGGFINHSNDPNCAKVKLLLTRQEWNHLADLSNNKFNLDFKKWNLITLQDVKEGEELTVRYTFYNV
jgi:SET domain-containing protein